MNTRSTTRTSSLFGLIILLALLAVDMALASQNDSNGPSSDFSGISNLEGYVLQPETKTVKVGAKLDLRVAFCFRQTDKDDLTYLNSTCSGVDDDIAAPVFLSEWSVNGVVGGNGIVGTVKANGASATYSAPATKPSPATVAVSVKAGPPGGSSTPSLLVSNITITDLKKFSGTVKFSAEAMEGQVRITDGSAEVTWTLVEDLPDVRSYTASGSMRFSLAPVVEDHECKPVRITDRIDTSNKLIVYTDRANWNPSTYGFTLTAADTDTAALTTECTDEDGDSFPVTFPKFLVLGVGGPCVPDINPSPIPFTDETLLEGTFGCPVNMFLPGLDASWKFTAE